LDDTNKETTKAYIAPSFIFSGFRERDICEKAKKSAGITLKTLLNYFYSILIKERLFERKELKISRIKRKVI
jgi:hypothetical protein